MRKRDLERIVRKWQRRLKLLDWDFDIEWANQAELTAFFAEDADEEDPAKIAKQAVATTDADGPEAYDTSAIENRSIRILVKKGANDMAEVERSIIHEMLHCMTWALTPYHKKKPTETIHLEQILNTLDGLLLQIK